MKFSGFSHKKGRYYMGLQSLLLPSLLLHLVVDPMEMLQHYLLGYSCRTGTMDSRLELSAPWAYEHHLLNNNNQ